MLLFKNYYAQHRDMGKIGTVILVLMHTISKATAKRLVHTISIYLLTVPGQLQSLFSSSYGLSNGL